MSNIDISFPQILFSFDIFNGYFYILIIRINYHFSYKGFWRFYFNNTRRDDAEKILYQEFVSSGFRPYIRILHGMGSDERYEAYPDEHTAIFIHSDYLYPYFLLSGNGNSDERKRRV